MSPYRIADKPAAARKLARRRARLRSFWRRVGGPTTFMLIVGGIFSFFNAVTCATTDRKIDDVDAVSKRHFDDWQALIDKNQAAMNTRQFELDNHEREFGARVRTFDDILSMSPMLTKNGADPAPLADALKRAGISSKKP